MFLVTGSYQKAHTFTKVEALSYRDIQRPSKFIMTQFRQICNDKGTSKIIVLH